MPKEGIHQFGRFVFVGALNTALDFAVFNSLIVVWGVASSTYLLFKSAGFLVAVLNSYLWNKYWVFRRSGFNQSLIMEQLLFLLVSLFGLGVNAVISYLVFLGVLFAYPPMPLIAAANIGAIAGTLCVLLFNYLGYRSLVFTKRHE